jgi:hypothetical protein
MSASRSNALTPLVEEDSSNTKELVLLLTLTVPKLDELLVRLELKFEVELLLLDEDEELLEEEEEK